MPTLIRFHQTGGPEVLQYDPVPARPLQSGEIRLQVEAIGLNRAEVMYREGQYVETPTLPSILGFEAAGVVFIRSSRRSTPLHGVERAARQDRAQRPLTAWYGHGHTKV